MPEDTQESSTARGRGHTELLTGFPMQSIGYSTQEPGVKDWWYISTGLKGAHLTPIYVLLGLPSDNQWAHLRIHRQWKTAWNLLRTWTHPCFCRQMEMPPPQAPSALPASGDLCTLPVVTPDSPPPPPVSHTPCYPRRNRAQPDGYCPGLSH